MSPMTGIRIRGNVGQPRLLLPRNYVRSAAAPSGRRGELCSPGRTRFDCSPIFQVSRSIHESRPPAAFGLAYDSVGAGVRPVVCLVIRAIKAVAVIAATEATSSAVKVISANT